MTLDILTKALPGPTIVPVVSKNDGVGFDNLFFKDNNVWTDDLTQALLSTDDTSLLHRDPDNGAWTFKANTEQDLLQHVTNGLAVSIKDLDDVDASKAILRSIDVYCLGKQWMYHVGHEKGEEITPFLQECISSRLSSSDRFIILDVGTYCGYSAILLAMVVRKFAPDLDFHVYSTEINPMHLEVATSLIKLAKLESYISLILTNPTAESLSDVLARHIPKERVDFMFLDHAKDMYLSDLQLLEKSGYVQEGTHVVADNVVVSEQLQKYCDYVGCLADQSIVKTKMIEGKLEYSENLKDGMGKHNCTCMVLMQVHDMSMSVCDANEQLTLCHL
eukprot:CAMPEP_0178696770 /NCGR_PEP_ID=MMETSP0699-20121125/9590_1 /TAXON_ID=265572 /ORGANISM="Extubocellulus spinifer, Strain CCMP396" /LENGTH=332 /DNA_ID=CAMNT_0020342605 /DNA_START=556 /DNA_END=1554 /DNA_ORIENTATION=+